MSNAARAADKRAMEWIGQAASAAGWREKARLYEEACFELTVAALACRRMARWEAGDPEETAGTQKRPPETRRS